MGIVLFYLYVPVFLNHTIASMKLNISTYIYTYIYLYLYIYIYDDDDDDDDDDELFLWYGRLAKGD